jgi:hypothetical protein
MTHWPSDLADAVSAELNGERKPPGEVLRLLFQTMWFASLRTEEGSPIAFHVVYIDPDDPDPRPPVRIVQDRWAYVPLGQHLPFTVSNVVKIARASDPRSSSFAVYHDKNHELFVWGLIDQGNRYYDFVISDSESGPERPGLFQASIVGVGHVVAYRGYKLIADLRVSELRGPAIDPLMRGPLLEVLRPGINRLVEQVRLAVGAELRDERWDAYIAMHWLLTLRRLLLRIQQCRHGGAVLISANVDAADLSIKYPLLYERLKTSLHRNALFQIRHAAASNEIYSGYMERHRQQLPLSLYLEESISNSDLEETRSEIDGALWFVSLLSRVDGLVLLSPDLDVLGFGVEIRTSDPPKVLVQANDARATKRNRAIIDYHHFGTRHRSMMRYCAKAIGSVGFVISQDGDVRAMTRKSESLLLWDNVKLRHDDFERRKRKKNARLTARPQ